MRARGREGGDPERERSHAEEFDRRREHGGDDHRDRHRRRPQTQEDERSPAGAVGAPEREHEPERRERQDEPQFVRAEAKQVPPITDRRGEPMGESGEDQERDRGSRRRHEHDAE